MAEEVKEIGVPIDLTGTFSRTELLDGKLVLQKEEDLGGGVFSYYETGYWISTVVNLGDKFKSFEKIFVDSVNNGSSFTLQTRSSVDSVSWSLWADVLNDGTIQSPTAQYIQIRINLTAGAEISTITFSHSGYLSNNDFIDNALIEVDYKIPALTANDSSPDGIAFADSIYAIANDAWRAFDGTVTMYASATTNINGGFVGYMFNEKRVIDKYMVRALSVASTLNSTIKDFVFEASADTTNGTDGTWITLDTQVNQLWTTVNQQRDYPLNNTNYYKAYRIRWTSNGGNALYTSVGELQFYSPDIYGLKLKREYSFDMTLDSTWSEEGSLHRKYITRDEWLRIDRLEIGRR